MSVWKYVSVASSRSSIRTNGKNGDGRAIPEVVIASLRAGVEVGSKGSLIVQKGSLIVGNGNLMVRNTANCY